MLTTRYKPRVNVVLDPLARGIARSGLSPSALTIVSPILTALACLWFLRTRAVVAFCLVMLAVGLLDALDGALARVTQRVTKWGAYLDAICDRYVELMVLLAAASVTGYWALCLVVLSGSLLVSYAKARSAMEVPVVNDEWPDLMERTERSVLFLLGFAASRLIPAQPLGHDLFWWTLMGLAILIHVTAIQRVLRARRFIRERAG